MKIRGSLSVALAVTAIAGLMSSTGPVKAYSADDQENAPPASSVLLPSKPARVVERLLSNTETIHNPAGSQMLVARLSIVPACDGYIDATEWSDANMYDISDTTGQEDGVSDPLGTVYLWLKQDDNGLYFAVRNNADQALGDYDQVGLYFDDNHDGCFPASATNEGNSWLINYPSGVAVMWRWLQDTNCGYPPNYVCSWDNSGALSPWTPPCFGMGIGPTGVVDYEIMIPYGAVDEHLDTAMPPDSLGFFIMCYDAATYGYHGEWPSQGRSSTYREPCYYGHLICEGPDSLYWKPPYENYAPSGMPDISMFQGYGWFKLETGLPTFDGPCAVANCFKWFDSKYEEGFVGVPGDADDRFPLVRDYLDMGPYFIMYDDHDPANVDADWMFPGFTPWLQGATTPPPPTLQPFVPGYQYPPQPMPPWGELVERLAWYLDLDGVQSGYCNHSGTRPQDMHDGIQDWLDSETFTDGSTLADTLCVNIWPMPEFELVETLVEKCEDMILLLGFWWQDPTGQWWRNGGHWVTVAGINSQDFLIAFSDPFIDNAEYGGRGRVGTGTILPHDHGIFDHWTHNDEGNVSHDVYEVIVDPVSPGGLWEIVDYGLPYATPDFIATRFEYSNVPPEFEPATMEYDTTRTLVTEVEYAIQVSPWDYRGDINIVPGGDGVVDVGDVVFLVNYLYRFGPTPDPYWEADVTCDGIVDVGDVVYLVNYLYRNGPVPKCCDP